MVLVSRDYLVKTCDISQERLESDIIVFGVRARPLVEHCYGRTPKELLQSAQKGLQILCKFYHDPR